MVSAAGTATMAMPPGTSRDLGSESAASAPALPVRIRSAAASARGRLGVVLIGPVHDGVQAAFRQSDRERLAGYRCRRTSQEMTARAVRDQRIAATEGRQRAYRIECPCRHSQTAGSSGPGRPRLGRAGARWRRPAVCGAGRVAEQATGWRGVRRAGQAVCAHAAGGRLVLCPGAGGHCAGAPAGDAA